MSPRRLIPVLAALAVGLVQGRARACTLDTDCGRDMLCQTSTTPVCTSPTPPAHDPLCTYSPVTTCVPRGAVAPDGGEPTTDAAAPPRDDRDAGAPEADGASRSPDANTSDTPPGVDADEVDRVDAGRADVDAAAAGAARAGGCAVGGGAGRAHGLLAGAGLLVGLARLRRRARR
jgi:hypothetical protein